VLPVILTEHSVAMIRLWTVPIGKFRVACAGGNFGHHYKQNLMAVDKSQILNAALDLLDAVGLRV